jgi:hypothetical protein
MKKIAILQSNYIPWKGYFDLINMVDEFILYDDMQYTKNDWRNRNKIQTKQGVQWLTIPVSQESLEQKIIDTKVTDKKWNVKHWRTLSQCYAKAPYFKEYKAVFEDFFLSCDEVYLSKINFELINIINHILGIKTTIRLSSEFDMIEGQTAKLLDICKQTGANTYLSGPAAKGYFDEDLARRMGINVEWMDYSDYSEYKQLHQPFVHGVTILDLIFNEGPNATKFMKSF